MPISANHFSEEERTRRITSFSVQLTGDEPYESWEIDSRKSG